MHVGVAKQVYSMQPRQEPCDDATNSMCFALPCWLDSSCKDRYELI